MKFNELELSGAFLIETEKIEDERGYFTRSFCRETFKKNALDYDFPQENISFSKSTGTLRGLHYQAAPYAETKLVTCTRGKIFDVIVDINKGSKTHGRWIGVELEAGKDDVLYIPSGFAHGFITLQDDSEVRYHMSREYKPEAARCIHWQNPELRIQWPMSPSIMSASDKSAEDTSWQD